MATPAFLDVRREADRINREVPELTQKTASLREAQQKAREIQEKAEQARLTFTSVAGRLIRACDQLIEAIEAMPADVAEEKAALLAQVKKDRRQAFEDMREANPDQAWFWTEEWQASERAVDRDIFSKWGRATFHYADEKRDKDTLVVWRAGWRSRNIPASLSPTHRTVGECC